MSKEYWDQQVEDAIIAYQQCDDDKERDRIYTKHIHKSLTTLCDNVLRYVIFTKTIVVDDYEYEVWLSELINLCVEKLGYFKPESGFKSFSFFQTIAKNKVIDLSRRSYKYNTHQVEYDGNVNFDSDFSYEIDPDYNFQINLRIRDRFNKLLQRCYEKRKIYKKSYNKSHYGLESVGKNEHAINIFTAFNEYLELNENSFNQDDMVAFTLKKLEISARTLRTVMSREGVLINTQSFEKEPFKKKLSKLKKRLTNKSTNSTMAKNLFKKYCDLYDDWCNPLLAKYKDVDEEINSLFEDIDEIFQTKYNLNSKKTI